MQKESKLTLARVLGLALVISAFFLPQAGRTQITLVEEYKGKIKETKPKELLHSMDTAYHSLSPGNVTNIKKIIKDTDNPVLRDALENVILLDLYQKDQNEQYLVLLNEARDFLKEYPDGDPMYRPHILFSIAEAFYALDNYDSAKIHYRTLVDDYPHSEVAPYARHSLGWCYMHLDRYTEADSEFVWSAVNNDLLVSTYFGLGINYFNAGRYADAIEMFMDEKKYQEIGIWNSLAKDLVGKNYYYKGLTYERLGKRLEAISNFRKVAEDFPAHPRIGAATYQVGLLSFYVEDYPQAIKYFNKALNMTENGSEARDIRMKIAQSYFDSGNYGASISYWREILEDYSTEEALIGLEQSYVFLADSTMRDINMESDSLARLLSNFGEDVPLSRDLSTYQFELSGLYYDEGDFENALHWSALAIAGKASEDVIRGAKELRLFCLFHLGKWEELMNEGDRFQRDFPTYVAGDFLFILGVGHARRGDELKQTSQARANDYYKSAIPLLERFLAESSSDNANRDVAERVLEFCRSQIR